MGVQKNFGEGKIEIIKRCNHENLFLQKLNFLELIRENTFCKNQYCIVFLVGCTTTHLIRIVARLLEQDEMENRKVIVSSFVCRIGIKYGKEIGF